MDWLGFGTGVLQTVGTLAAQNAANQAQQDLNLENRIWSKEMWEMQNAYNHPSAIRARLQYAGINPALALQNGQGVVKAEQPNTPQTQAPDFSILGAGINSAAANFLQAKSIDANTDLLASQAEGYRIDNLTRLQKNLAEIENLIAISKEKGANTSYLEWQRDQSMQLYDALSKRNYAEVENIRMDTQLKQEQKRKEAALADYQQILSNYGVQNQEKVLRNLDAQYLEILSAASNNDASAAYAAAQKALTDVNSETARKIMRDVVNRAFYEADYERYKAANERKSYKVGSGASRFAPAIGNLRYKHEPKHRGGVR